MEPTSMVIVAIVLLGSIALIGFFKTKTDGFGKYNTCTLVLLVVFVLCTLLLSAGRMSGETFGHAVMAIIGFAGGLVVAREK